MRACPGKDLLERYIAGLCQGRESEQLQEHIILCEHCRDRAEKTRATIDADAESSPPTDPDRTQPINEDQRPTESLLEATVVTAADRDFTQSVESMIEGYKIVEALPRGGQAVVYKAVHVATKTNVAIKVLLPTLLGSERARYYFEREAELIAGLDHPNIVSIRDSGLIHGQYYFVMQYIDGEPLRRYVQANKLTFRERAVLFSKICSAITYAHQQGVIHRDLKFANILVDKRGEPHILDFGLAKAVGMNEKPAENAVVTMTGQWAGSLSTMSPEQAAGQPNMIDVRADVYSLGVILYNLLTGQYPYDVTGPTLDVLRNIQQADPVRPTQIIRKFNSEMEAILLTALEKKREDRYQSAADLQADVENWLEGRPIRVKSISTIYLLKKIVARHRYTSTVVALLAIIILGFAYVSFELFMNAEKALAKSEATATGLREQEKTARFRYLQAEPLFFANFLQAWREGRRNDADDMAQYFFYKSKDSKEWKASLFLLGHDGASDQEEAFRRVFPPEYVWFADFAIGEYRLKKGEKKTAFEAYNRGYQAIHQLSPQKRSQLDKLVIEQLKGRLYELRNENISAGPNSAKPNGGP